MKRVAKLFRDQRVEEVADVLAVRDAGERRVLAAQAVPAVQCDEHEKPRLPRREAERLEGADPVVDHVIRGAPDGADSKGVPPRRPPPPRPPPAPDARYIAKPAAPLPASWPRE